MGWSTFYIWFCMFRKECPTCGSNPSFPYLNKQHYMQRYVVEIQYNMIMIKFPGNGT